MPLTLPPVAFSARPLYSVVNSIKKWVDNYAVDFLENPEMTKTLQAFMSSIDPSDTASVLHLGRALDRLLANNPADRNGRGRGGALSVEELTQSEVSAVALARARLDQAKDSSQGGQDRQGTNLDRLIGRWANPRPSAPIAGTRYASFLEIDPLEFARQLTMIEFELFCQIRAQDFHDLAWMSKNKETLAFGATQLTRWSTRVRPLLMHLTAPCAPLIRDGDERARAAFFPLVNADPLLAHHPASLYLSSPLPPPPSRLAHHHLDRSPTGSSPRSCLTPATSRPAPSATSGSS